MYKVSMQYSFAYCGKRPGKHCGRTDRQTGIKSIVLYGYTGRGLIIIAFIHGQMAYFTFFQDIFE
jgi:hypothetical protein